MAKKFISFLGTNNYLNVNYYEGENRIDNVRFIQEALIRMNYMDWLEEDELLIFYTDLSKIRNWDDNGHERIRCEEEKLGLNTILNNIVEDGLKAKITTVNIPEGFTEDEIWEIFEKVFNRIEEGDEIYFDVTHAFRIIPMITIPLLNYSKFLKNTTVRSIHYGAFEKLGPVFEVQNMPLEERDAPIVNLNNLSQLQDWTNAVNNFIVSGDVKEISRLAQDNMLPSNRAEMKNDVVAQQVNKLSIQLPKFFEELSLCRGKGIINGKSINGLLNIIEELTETPNKAFNPIFNKLKVELSQFNRTEDVLNGINAAKWCFSKGMLQQSITILQETIVSYFCDINNLDIENISDRKTISSAFSFISNNIQEEKWKLEGEKYRSLVKQLIDNDLLQTLSKEYSILTQMRNDINHCGMNIASTNSKVEERFNSKIENIFEKIDSLCL